MTSTLNRTISIADEYTRYPGPRYAKNGAHSGEVFRDTILVPALRIAVQNGGRVTVFLDDVAGYGSSFLEEAFGGLLRGPHRFSQSDLSKHLEIQSRTNRFKHHVVRALQYIAEESDRQAAGIH